MSSITKADDAAPAIASQLIGTWRYAEADEPTGFAYLHFADDGRYFQFVYQREHPEKRIPLRLWYAVETSSTMRIRSKGSPDGWTSNFSFDGTKLILKSTSSSD